MDVCDIHSANKILTGVIRLVDGGPQFPPDFLAVYSTTFNDKSLVLSGLSWSVSPAWHALSSLSLVVWDQIHD